VVSAIPIDAGDLLEAGAFCHVAASTPEGPHVTPMVFALAGGRLWVTTSRRSVKARAWRRDPRVAGIVRSGGDVVMFTGTATTHDVLDPGTWVRSLREGPLLALASARFTRKNARFFAGYAIDARRVPFAWTPPGRVFVELRIERTALIDGRGRVRVSGEWADDAPSRERFRAVRSGPGPLDGLPPGVRDALGERGVGALAVEGRDGPVVVPAAWTLGGVALYAVVNAGTLALAGAGTPTPRVALGIDRPTSWRAREMVGAMARGDGEIHVTGHLTSGQPSARDVARRAGVSDDAVALVRVRPRRFVWWQGWESGTVGVT
jgi:nitroimidazol reductase NimA-like FMN-containing flavoprotein (pyridoxamine 5'-phosphate oxidase superfamily)